MPRGVEIDVDLLEYAMARLREIASDAQPSCKICGGQTELFDVVDLNKTCDYKLYPRGLAGIPVFYWSCTGCGFIFTNFFDRFRPDQWRKYIYNDEYICADPEYSDSRPRRNALEIDCLLAGKKDSIIAVDYGGGSGRTAVLLREMGWTCDTCDPFGHTEMQPERRNRYNFCSAFEVFEHSPDPVASLRTIVELCSPDQLLILVGTGVSDASITLRNRLTWWYAAPRNGHISLYSRKSLRHLGERLGLSYESVSPGTHLFFRRFAHRDMHWLLMRGKLFKRLRLVLRGR